MKLFSHNAENLLLARAKNLSGHHATWRCIHINFADHKDEYSQGLRTHVVTTIIKELLENEEGYIYLCEDGDVFILFQGKTLPIIDRLGEYFKGMHQQNKSSQPEDELYTVFDLSTHWQIFLALCKSKVTEPMPQAVPVILTPVAQTKATLPQPDEAVFRTACTKRHGRKQLTVLVVEDDPFTRRLVISTLKGQFDVIEAADGVQAIHAYEMHAPDLVFLDIELPDVNGHVILAKLLALDPSAFIVMLSANSIKENILAALEKGAHGFVSKPFTKEKLMHYLQLCETARRGHKLEATHV